MTCTSKFKSTFKDDQEASGVQNLANTSFKSIEDAEQGDSWLELYTLYKLTGGQCMVDKPENLAAPRPAMRHQLKAFVRPTKAIVRLIIENDDAMRFNHCLNAE